MNRTNTSWGTIIYILIGVVVASNRGYFTDISTVSGIISALLAVVLWPVLFFGVNLHVTL